MVCVAPLLNSIMDLMEAEIEALRHIPSSQIYQISSKDPKLLAPYMERLLDQYFNASEYMILRENPLVLARINSVFFITLF